MRLRSKCAIDKESSNLSSPFPVTASKSWGNSIIFRTRIPLVMLCLIISSLLPPASPGQDDEWDYDKTAGPKALAMFKMGLKFQKDGDLHNAVEAYRRSIGFTPRNAEVHWRLAQCLTKLGNYTEADTEFRNSLNLNGNFVECRNDYGMFLDRREDKYDPEGAVREWKRCVQVNAQYPYPHYNLATYYHKKGDLEAAIQYFETTVRLKPDYADAWKELGMCIFERASNGDLTSAVEALEKSAKLAPDNPKVHYYLGFIYSTKGNLDAGEAEYRKALMCEQRLAAAHWELARLRYLRGDLDRCMAEVKEAQKVNPAFTKSMKYPDVNPIEMKTATARCLEFKNRLPEAIDAYQELVRARGSDALYALKIEELTKKIKLEQKLRKKTPLTYDPEEVDAFVSKGIEQYEDGQLDAAKASFERALELNPNSVEATMNISAVQEAQGDLKAAVATNQKATQICPGFDGAYYNLAYLLEKLELPAEAGMMYKKYHDLSGKYPYDPQHIIDLQQDLLRQQKLQENMKRRGY